MNKTLLVIDSYINSQDRASVCESLIKKIRKHFVGYEILLINKSNDSFGLELKVDYYFNYGKGFMVGYPPQEILDRQVYSMPYVYYENSGFICENWMPLTGMTDHVAGIYNSFIISKNIAKMLGYSKVFKMEFDTNFDDDDIIDIKFDIDRMNDYLFYGYRKEGQWAPDDYYLIDVHICGFDVKIFEDFKIVQNDDEYWELCKNIKYYGKWIEYVIPRILEYQKVKNDYFGLMYEGNLRDKYVKTNFDIINSPGGWTEKWKDLPKICKISYDGGKTEKPNEVILFYYNNDYESVLVNSKICVDEIDIEEKNIRLDKGSWFYLHKTFNEKIRIISENISDCGENRKYDKTITKDEINNLKCRMIFK